MNGKLDLTQAEAVQELICAKNEHALDAAESHLAGRLSQRISFFQQSLTQIAAILEAWVDFPEEGLEFASMEDVCAELELIESEMQRLLATFHDGRIVHEGLSLCLVGSPNVGKSSLMNALLDKNRAIVSNIPGTTRDLVEDQMRLSGLNFTLVDTAGIRDTHEIIEQEGIRRSKAALNQADIVLLVFDAAKGIQEDDKKLLEIASEKNTVIVWNKVDLANLAIEPLPFKHIVQVSAIQKQGLEELKQKIDSVVWEKGPPAQDELLITNIRHKEALSEAIQACKEIIRGLKQEVSPEFLGIDMRSCLSALGRIIGTDITEDVLSAIFSKFCVGK